MKLNGTRSIPFRLLLAIAALLCAGAVDAGPQDYLKKSDDWFAGDDAKRIAKNILSFQSKSGAWPKNVDTTTGPYSGDRSKLKGTYDNGATTDELRFLARLYAATQDNEYRDAFARGLDYVLGGQYENGGWPQSYPPGNGYHRHITFNDDAMVRLLYFVREVAVARAYDFVDKARRKAAATAFDRGVKCILKCQIKCDGRLTVWCAQHDERDFSPRSGRTYELATLSGAESVGITQLLMSIDNPSPEIVNSVDAAVAWFERAKLRGIRVVKEKTSHGADKVVVHDPKAPPLWARFYCIETNAPVFVDRDGVPKRALADIGYERRNGYAWYGNWPKTLLDGEYRKWKQRTTAKAKN
jgi:pectate lyase